MKFTTAIAALAGVAIAAPVAETESLEKRATPINYVQNYNGNLANFKYNEGAGTYSASWNNPGDFVVGLGWNKGSARTINFKGSYQTGGSSYYAVYGWLNNPLTGKPTNLPTLAIATTDKTNQSTTSLRTTATTPAPPAPRSAP